MLATALQGFSLGFAAGSSPGPFQAFLLSEAVQRGWRQSLPLSLAPLLSDGPIIALTVLLLSRMPDSFLAALQIAGGLFILYLAWTAFTTWRSNQLAAPDSTKRPSLLKGALMNMLNPGPWLFWGTVGAPLIISGWRTNPLVGGSFLFFFYLSMTATNVALIVLFASLGNAGGRFRHGLLALSVLALGGFGVYQLVSGLRGFT